MADYVILTDSSCDLPAELADQMQLTVLPLTVDMDGKLYRNYLDGREIMEVRCHFSFSEFYRQEIWGPQRYHLVTISKFGCCVERDTVTYRNKYYYHHESVR